MNKLQAIWYMAIWAKEWAKLCLHYLRVWEPGAAPGLSREETEDCFERMRTGPLRYEYERVEALKDRAIEAWQA